MRVSLRSISGTAIETGLSSRGQLPCRLRVASAMDSSRGRERGSTLEKLRWRAGLFSSSVFSHQLLLLTLTLELCGGATLPTVAGLSPSLPPSVVMNRLAGFGLVLVVGKLGILCLSRSGEALRSGRWGSGLRTLRGHENCGVVGCDGDTGESGVFSRWAW